jgi:hypothetical protein
MGIGMIWCHSPKKLGIHHTSIDSKQVQDRDSTYVLGLHNIAIIGYNSILFVRCLSCILWSPGCCIFHGKMKNEATSAFTFTGRFGYVTNGWVRIGSLEYFSSHTTYIFILLILISLWYILSEDTGGNCYHAAEKTSAVGMVVPYPSKWIMEE